MNNSSVFSEKTALPSELVRTIENAFERSVNEFNANTAPDLDKSKTAIFTSSQEAEWTSYVESELQAKIRADFSRMIDLGCDTLIVNTGTHYGMLALRELVDLKDKIPFRLIRSKIRGEFSEEPGLQEAILLSSCDSAVYANNPEHYAEEILSRSAYISDENGFTKA